mgnify:CR=1 FL=1
MPDFAVWLFQILIPTVELTSRQRDRYRAALEEIASDYYHDKHAILARKVLDNENA